MAREKFCAYCSKPIKAPSWTTMESHGVEYDVCSVSCEDNLSEKLRVERANQFSLLD